MEPQPPVETTPVPAPLLAPPKPKNNSFLIILLSVLLLLATSLAFFFALQTQKLAKQLASMQAQSTPSPIPTATPDVAASWKTYTYGSFLIKLPPEWHTTELKNPIQFLNYTPDPKSGGSFNPSTDKGKLKVEIYQNSTSDSLESYLAQQKSSAIEAIGNEINWQETKAVVAGKEAVRVKTTTPGFTYNFKDVSSNTIFSITFALDFDNYRELSDQILATFKFLD